MDWVEWMPAFAGMTDDDVLSLHSVTANASVLSESRQEFLYSSNQWVNSRIAVVVFTLN